MKHKVSALAETAGKRLTPLYFLMLFTMELLLRLWIYDDPWNPTVLGYIALFSLLYSVALRLLTGLAGPKLNFILAVILLAVVTILFMAQYIYYLFFKTPVLVFSIFQAAQIGEFSGEAWRMISAHLPQTLSFLLPPAIVLALGRRHFTPLAARGLLRLVCLGCLVYLTICWGLGQSGRSPASPYTIYYNENNPAASQESLGMLTELRLDAQRFLFGFSPREMPQAVTVAPVAAPSAEPTPAEEIVYPPNALEIDFDRLIAGESDSELLTMHQYFSSLTPTLQNEYTGLFAGKNLIFITAEGFSHYLIDSQLCPTIHRLATEGFEFTNFYTPIWNVSTSDGEYVAATGLLPKSGVWSFSRSADNYLPFVMGRQLAAQGYSQPIAYHNHSYTYYDRHLSHPNMGYDFRAPGHGLAITEIWPESDLEMMENSVADYLDAAPFHIYYMTVSGHLEYNFGGNSMAARHRQQVADLPYSDEVKAYIACNLELEAALSYLLTALEEAGELENTVIVLSSDHYPYGLTEAAYDELAGHQLERNFELYRNGLIIWQAEVEHQVIDQPTSSLDILPTLSNLFGLEFDSRLLMGRDVFAPDSLPLVVFNNRSWITDQASYNSASGQVIGNVDEAYAASVDQLVNAKFVYSAKILEQDYYRVVLNAGGKEQ